jgi:hypothetical protein
LPSALISRWSPLVWRWLHSLIFREVPPVRRVADLLGVGRGHGSLAPSAKLQTSLPPHISVGAEVIADTQVAKDLSVLHTRLYRKLCTATAGFGVGTSGRR